MSKPIYLIPNDSKGSDEKLLVTRRMAMMSNVISEMLYDEDDEDYEEDIPIEDVNTEILKIVIKFLEKHQNDPMAEIIKPITDTNIKNLVSDWDANFIEDLALDTLYEVIMAANYMDIQPLLSLGLCRLACLVKGKDENDVKSVLNLGDVEISAAEQLQIIKENPWILNPKT